MTACASLHEKHDKGGFPQCNWAGPRPFGLCKPEIFHMSWVKSARSMRRRRLWHEDCAGNSIYQPVEPSDTNTSALGAPQPPALRPPATSLNSTAAVSDPRATRHQNTGLWGPAVTITSALGAPQAPAHWHLGPLQSPSPRPLGPLSHQHTSLWDPQAPAHQSLGPLRHQHISLWDPQSTAPRPLGTLQPPAHRHASGSCTAKHLLVRHRWPL